MSGTKSTQKIATDQITGSARILRVFKRKTSSSSVRRICIVCQKTAIHRNDAQYRARVCLRCAAEGPRPSGSPVARRSSTATLLEGRARALRGRLPKSEAWFQDQWRRLGMADKGDRFNVAFGFYIPDCINQKFKYVIEVDGDIHDRPEQKKHDRQRDKYFQQKGFTVFRLKAYDRAGLEALCDSIDALRTPRQPSLIPQRGNS